MRMPLAWSTTARDVSRVLELDRYAASRRNRDGADESAAVRDEQLSERHLIGIQRAWPEAVQR